jgi:hypothetical protein
MNLKRRQELCLDGIETSLTMARIAYSRLEHAVTRHSQTVSQNRGESMVDAREVILLDAWSLIDITNRLRVLVRRTPGLEQNAFVEAFLRPTPNVEKLRNFVQHLDGEMASLVETGWPIWGALSWVWVPPEMQERRTVGIMSIIPGRLAKSGGYPLVNPVGKQIRPPVDHISLSAAGITVNLSDMFRTSTVFGSRFEAALARARETQSECSNAAQNETFLRIVLDGESTSAERAEERTTNGE